MAIASKGIIKLRSTMAYIIFLNRKLKVAKEKAAIPFTIHPKKIVITVTDRVTTIGRIKLNSEKSLM
jgi:hypothetical protein